MMYDAYLLLSDD